MEGVGKRVMGPLRGELGGRWALFMREGLGATEGLFVREAVSKDRGLGHLGDPRVFGSIWEHLREVLWYLERGRWVLGEQSEWVGKSEIRDEVGNEGQEIE